MTIPLSYASPATVGPTRPLIPTWLLVVCGIIAPWIGVTVFGMLAYAALAPIVLLVIRRRYALVALCLLLTPISVSFFAGATSYAMGIARLSYMGLPGSGFYNLDPDLRCERSTGGCIVNGSEWMTDLPNNAAITLLTRLFGAQPSAYTGPYPTEAQAGAALASATPVSLAALVKDQVEVCTPPVKLDVGVGQGLLSSSLLLAIDAESTETYAVQVRDKLGPVTATLAHGPCLIVRIPIYEDTARIALIDTATGRPFAFYAEGKLADRFPPVTWRR